jgi:acetyltransferase-like isoleucine patch superfamily enzyme
VRIGLILYRMNKLVLHYKDTLFDAIFKRVMFDQYKGFYISHKCVVKHPQNIKIGKGSVIGDALIGAAAPITIGENVTISWGAIIETGSLTRSLNSRHKSEPIIIGKNAWICAGAMVLGGAVIPDGAIVPAGRVWGKRGLQ